MAITTEDRAALLLEGVVVHSVHVDAHGTRVYATGPDEARARELVTGRLGAEIDVTVCGDSVRESRPKPCYGHMEREPGRLQLRYENEGDEHVDLIVVAEDEERVVVFGTVCAPIDLVGGDIVDSPYHVYLDQPLGKRVVIDGVRNEPVPYFNVYDGIEERVAKMRSARGESGALGSEAS